MIWAYSSKHTQSILSFLYILTLCTVPEISSFLPRLLLISCHIPCYELKLPVKINSIFFSLSKPTVKAIVVAWYVCKFMLYVNILWKLWHISQCKVSQILLWSIYKCCLQSVQPHYMKNRGIYSWIFFLGSPSIPPKQKKKKINGGFLVFPSQLYVLFSPMLLYYS